MFARHNVRRMFPVGLYAGLLFALVALRRPALTDGVESTGLTLLSLPLRAYALAGGAPQQLPAVGGADAAVAALERRLESAVRARPTQIAPALEPLPCGVIESFERGAGDREAVLALDRSWAAVADCEAYVTRGDVLLGFLGMPSRERDDWRDLPARVELLHYRGRDRSSRRVAAYAIIGDDDRLGFLLEPASAIDQWPLRCTLLDDPYLAASLGSDDYLVRTARVDDDPLGTLPGFLRIGHLRVFGYARAERVLPIGLYVEPIFEVSTITDVVLWRQRGSRSAPSRARVELRRHRVRSQRVPAPPPTGERWFAMTADSSVRPRRGAGVVDGARLVGTVAAAGRGFAVVSPFGVPGRTWPVTILPDDPSQPPLGIVVRTVERAVIGPRALIRLRVESRPVEGRLRDGDLFTAAVGPDCPSRLWLGRVAIRGEDLIVETPAAFGASLEILERRSGP